MFDFFLQRGGSNPSNKSSSSASSGLPIYSPLSAQTFDQASTASSSSSPRPRPSPLSPTEDDGLAMPPLELKPAQRHAHHTALSRPSLSRFLADFTLGFADGLTVPFALTAGLSSLGQTDTVIYAGMAEICAGSISMGIGGYLSAKGEQQQQQQETTRRCALAAAAATDEEDVVVDEKASQQRAERSVEGYLAPLYLPPELLNLVRDHIHGRDDVAASLAREMLSRGEGDDDDGDDDEDVPPSPIMSGLSVALGYLVGGSLPLFPYFVVSQVGDGLLWSFIVCIVALFSFGFTKDLVLHLRMESDVWIKDKDLGRRRWAWSDIRRSSWEGLQMVLLGSMAALAAVLCVRLFDSMGHDTSQP